MQECQQAFVNADIDNDIHGDLHSKRGGKNNNKRRLNTNTSHVSGSPRYRSRNNNGSWRDQQPGRFKKGDCIHHPLSISHVTTNCRDPFGLTSAFGRAVSYADKCSAIQKSVKTGWSPRATHVKIPQGYGCDANSATAAPVHSAVHPAPPLRTNQATMLNAPPAINDSDLRTYHKVSALISAGSPSKSPTAATASATYPPQTGAYHAPAISPLRAFHAATGYAFPGQPMQYPQLGAYPPPPYSHVLQHPAYPHSVRAPVRTNAATMPRPNMPPPTDDDLIAAGMRYYATQASQHFR